MSHALLFEIGTEELPPSELPTVIPALRASAERMLMDARLEYVTVREFATPRRLAVVVEGLADVQGIQVVTVTGPPQKAGLDAQGRFTRAAEGFARAQGVTVEQLVTIQTERGAYLAAERRQGGRAAREVLPELLERLAGVLPFAKQMRWGEGDVRFSRPVRWVVALLDADVLAVRIAGVAADRVTYGHRFVRPEPIVLPHANAWVDRLTAALVLPDVEGRRAAVQREVDGADVGTGARSVVPAETLETVTHLVEYPVAVVGGFAETYLELPREVVETPIRRHQKCFPVESSDGRLAPRFVTVSNMPGADPSEIRRGNERVIKARLADAAFYFHEDLKIRPEERLAFLKGMVFQEQLGNLFEKTERLVVLSDAVGRPGSPPVTETVRRAARLAKSDLASGMVREFPELQGIIGAEYALRAGEPREVAQAIREHYLPRTADDGLPQTVAGAVLSVADKTDTVVGCLGVGLTPTGSQDPYGLRRQAHGVIQIALGERVDVSLTPVIDRALELFGAKLTEPPARTRERALELFRSRLTAALAARGLRADVVEAVLARGFDHPASTLKRAEALTTLIGRPDWEPLVITFKRTINILPARPVAAVAPGRFVHEAERELSAATAAAAPRVHAALASGEYTRALTEVASLRPVVDRFFEAVLVMDPDPAVQENRLALLTALANLLLPVADLRKIAATPTTG
jgi:glycyl-tRNA synthetase beta chain